MTLGVVVSLAVSLFRVTVLMLSVFCIWDTQRFEYNEHVKKVDHVPTTPDVCFDFCKNACGAEFSSLENRRDCFCTLHFHNQVKGCRKSERLIQSMFCGVLKRASVYSMLDCLHTPPSQCVTTATSRERFSVHGVKQHVDAR